MNTKQIEQFNTPMAHYFELGHIAGYEDGYNQAMKDTKSVFTKAEVDILVDILRVSINYYERHVELSKHDMNYFYERCDKNDPSTIRAFKYFKKSKTEYSKVRKQRNKLAVIQSKLKKLRGV